MRICGRLVEKCVKKLRFSTGVSNSFSTVGDIYIPGFYTGQTLSKKKFNQARPYISGPQTFLCAGTGNQLIEFRSTPATQIYSYDGTWHYLEITTSPGDDLRKSFDVARNGTDLKKKVITSLAVRCMPPATYTNCRSLLSDSISTQKIVFLLENNFSKTKFGGQAFALCHKILKRASCLTPTI